MPLRNTVFNVNATAEPQPRVRLANSERLSVGMPQLPSPFQPSLNIRNVRASGDCCDSRVRKEEEMVAGEEEEKDTCAQKTHSAGCKEIDGLGTLD